MGLSIGQRLVYAGLVERGVLGEALARSSSEPMALPEALSRTGVDPVAILHIACQAAGVEAIGEESLCPNAEVARLLPADFARRCLVLPLALDEGRLAVAAADPTDRHLLEEASRFARRPVHAVGARVDALLRAIESTYGGVALPPPRAGFAFSARRGAGDEASNARPQRRSLVPPGGADRSPSGSYPLPSASTELPPDDASADSWAVGPTRPRRGEAPRRSVAPGNARRVLEREARPLPVPIEDVGGVLATIRACTQRERVLAALLSAALAHARQAFCFRIRDGRLEGMDSAGSSLGAIAVRKIVLPLSAGSSPHRVLVDGHPHFGPLGLSATDQVLRVAIGSRGGRISMHGLWIDARPIGLLVADDVRTGQLGHERLGAYSHAASQTLRRLIVDRG